MTRPPVIVLAFVSALVMADAIGARQQSSFRSGTLGIRVDVLVTDGQKPTATSHSG